MSDSVRPHRWQPTRLPRPWDSLGKNTGVGCHFLLQCKWSESEVAQSCPTLATPTIRLRKPVTSRRNGSSWPNGVRARGPGRRIPGKAVALEMVEDTAHLDS